MVGAFEYTRVTSVEQGCALLSDQPGKAAVLAGGSDLLADIRNGHSSPSLLVDVKGIEELAGFGQRDETGFSIGACVPLNAIAEDATVRRDYRALAEAAMGIGSYQIRNRATIAGNLCNASPAADTAPSLLVLDATLAIRGVQEARSVPVHEFFAGVKQNGLREGEILTAIVLPNARPGARTKFLKKQRIRGHDLAILNMAGWFDPQTGELQVAIGSCAPTPVLLPALGEPVCEDDPIDDVAHRLNELAQRSVAPISDLRASANYRRELIPVFLERLLTALFHPDEARQV